MHGAVKSLVLRVALQSPWCRPWIHCWARRVAQLPFWTADELVKQRYSKCRTIGDDGIVYVDAPPAKILGGEGQDVLHAGSHSELAVQTFNAPCVLSE